MDKNNLKWTKKTKKWPLRERRDTASGNQRTSRPLGDGLGELFFFKYWYPELSLMCSLTTILSLYFFAKKTMFVIFTLQDYPYGPVLLYLRGQLRMVMWIRFAQSFICTFVFSLFLYFLYFCTCKELGLGLSSGLF